MPKKSEEVSEEIVEKKAAEKKPVAKKESVKKTAKDAGASSASPKKEPAVKKESAEKIAEDVGASIASPKKEPVKKVAKPAAKKEEKKDDGKTGAGISAESSIGHLGSRPSQKNEKIRIRLKAYENVILDQSAEKIVETAKRTGAKVSGPIPLPTKKEIVTIIRSPHKHKDSREQFEMRTHKRVIDILYPTQATIDSLMKLDLPAGVDIEIKL